jgi:molecular chaperone DnaK
LDISSETIEVLATNGDTHLGGKDFDSALIDYIISEFKKDSGIDISSDKAAVQRIKEASEKAKHDLSTQSEHQINLPFITMGQDNQPQHLMMTITKAKLEELVGELVEKSLEPVKKALADASLDKNQIDEIIMVGGMTRMPLIQKTVEEYFGKKPNLSVNPDEVVAMGAAIQGAVLKGDVKDILLLDVTPLTLAIETAGGVATPMIPRNTTIPASKSQVFSTYADNQTAVDVHVVQGERPLAADNKSLGKFTLSGIAPAPRGVPQIEVTFDLDANGILNVTAVDKGTNKSANITITGSSTLSDEEKDEAIKEAEKQKDADLARKAKIDAKNNAENTAYSAEKLIKDMGDKLSEEDKSELTKMKEEIDEMVKKDEVNKEEYEEKAKALQEKLMKVGEKIYSSGQATPGAEGQSGEESQTSAEGETKTEDQAQDVDSKPKDEGEEKKDEEKK